MTEPTVADLQRNVQPGLKASNSTDDNGNPSGGGVEGKGLKIEWQNGPRNVQANAKLAPSNGAFVEDAIWAAKQRLQFFQNSKYESSYNADAIHHLEKALDALQARRTDRQQRGVEGQHRV